MHRIELRTTLGEIRAYTLVLDSYGQFCIFCSLVHWPMIAFRFGQKLSDPQDSLTMSTVMQFFFQQSIITVQLRSSGPHQLILKKLVLQTRKEMMPAV